MTRLLKKKKKELSYVYAFTTYSPRVFLIASFLRQSKMISFSPPQTTQLRIETTKYSYQAYANVTFRACFKSSIKSSASSKPTDKRSKLSVMPSTLRCSSGTDAWVITDLGLGKTSLA